MAPGDFKFGVEELSSEGAKISHNYFKSIVTSLRLLSLIVTISCTYLSHLWLTTQVQAFTAPHMHHCDGWILFLSVHHLCRCKIDLLEVLFSCVTSVQLPAAFGTKAMAFADAEGLVTWSWLI